MVVDRCWYVCVKLGVEEVSRELDQLIGEGKYEEAIQLVEGLDIIGESKDMLIKCVLSYKRSC